MSKEKNEERQGVLERMGERSSDFWWNLVYFVILAVAIGFVLVNNEMSRIASPTGIGVLLVLGVLELYPTIYLVKLAMRLRESGQS